jgi:hypothetical protein
MTPPVIEMPVAEDTQGVYAKTKGRGQRGRLLLDAAVRRGHITLPSPQSADTLRHPECRP